MRLSIARFALALAIITPGALPAQTGKTRLANAIAVIVNDAVITYADVERFIEPVIDVLMQRYGNQPKILEERLAEARQRGTEQLVERQLILADWESSGFKLPESILEDEISERVRDRFGDQVSMTRTLQSHGITKEAYRKQLREEIIVGALRARNSGSQSVIISPQKIESYYVQNKEKFRQADRVKLRILTVNRKPADADGAKKLVEEIRAKINAGASFAEMASLYSEDSYRGKGGGRDWVERSELREEITKIAFALKAGELSPVIETREACYLVLVEQSAPAHIQALADVRDQIEKTLLTEERSRLQDKYIEKLKTKSFVRYF